MNRRPDDGFTLVEVLVALTIMGIMTGALVGTFDLATRSWKAGAGTQELESSMRLALDELQGQIRGALNETTLIDGRPIPLFFGSADTLQFVTGSSGVVVGDLTPGQMLVTWRVEPSDEPGEGGLVCERTLPEELQAEDAPRSETSQIAPMVVRMELRYFYYPAIVENEDEAASGIWADLWDPDSDDPLSQPQQLPEGVEIILGFLHPATGDTISLPPQFAPILAKTDLVRSNETAGGGFDELLDFR